MKGNMAKKGLKNILSPKLTMKFEHAQGELTHGSHRMTFISLFIVNVCSFAYKIDIDKNHFKRAEKFFFCLEVSMKELCAYETSQLAEL